MVHGEYPLNLQDFANAMIRRIQQNILEKGFSWRTMKQDELFGKIQKYAERKDWISVANIAFMLWENDQLAHAKASL